MKYKLSTNYEKIFTNILYNTENYIIDYKLKSLVIGISGGIDSALVCALAREICDDLDIKLYGASIPSSSNKPNEVERANKIGKHYCDEFELIKNVDYAASYIFNIDHGLASQKEKIRCGNAKARMRMAYLYDIAQENDGMVLSTDNLTEYYLGFWTLHGDVGDYGMIQNLWKTEVYGLAEWMKQDNLMECIDAVPTDGLGITNSDMENIWGKYLYNQSTLNERKMYEVTDKVLIDLMNGIEVNEENPVFKRYKDTEFKRKNPVNIKRDLLI